MPEKMLFIFNPNTGGNRLKNKLMEILCLFSQAGYEVTMHPTTGAGDAREAAFKAQGYDRVVCCGGDGTLNEVANGLMTLKTPPVLGYIPGGTTNDFATSLSLPKSNMVAAAKRIIEPQEIFECDIGSFNGRTFTYVAAFGAFTDVPYKTPQKFKNVVGYFAYILEAIQLLPNLNTTKMHIKCGEEEWEEDLLFGLVTNSVSVAGFTFPNKEKVQMDDGIFEVLLVRPPGNLADLGALSGALLTRNIESPALMATRCSQIVMESEEGVAWTLDGEYGGSQKRTDITVRQKALKICR